MRRRNWACFKTNHLTQVLRFITMLFAGWLLLSSIVVAQSVTLLRDAEYGISDSSVLPDMGRSWNKVGLPHRMARPDTRELTGYWYRLVFNAQSASHPLWLLFPKLRSGGTVYLNGFMIGRISEADSQTQRRWFRPYMFVAPPVALRTGNNEIMVHFAIREPLTSFGEVLVGSEQEIRSRHDSLLFWENTVTEVASFLCLIVGGLTFVIWVRRRQEALYGIFSVCTLFWGVRTIIFRMPEVDMSYWVEWRFLYYLTTAGFIVCISVFMLRFSNCVKPRLERFLCAYWLTGCTLFMAIGVPARPVMDAWWTLGFLPFTLYSVLVLSAFTHRTRNASAVAMLAAVGLALTLALHDFAVQHGLFGLAEFYLLHLGIPAFLLVMALVLLERFLKTLELADSMQDSLTAKVAERERELMESHERLRKLERLNATAEERQRIMQNLHDGVGSQLITSLMLVKGGNAGQADMINLLQDCIDEMRMALDSLSAEQDDLLNVLGNFRARISPRFSAIGLQLNWVIERLPDPVQISPQTSLQVLRILQEALANVLKHAEAGTVTVTIGMKNEALSITIADDGIGNRHSNAATGNGVGNMHSRAARIKGAVDIVADQSGTVVYLSVPLTKAESQADASDSLKAIRW